MSLVFFESPSPSPGEHCPATPIVISRSEFSSGTPVSLSPLLRFPTPQKPLSLAAAPDSHLPPGAVSIHSWHRR